MLAGQMVTMLSNVIVAQGTMLAFALRVRDIRRQDGNLGSLGIRKRVSASHSALLSRSDQASRGRMQIGVDVTLERIDDLLRSRIIMVEVLLRDDVDDDVGVDGDHALDHIAASSAGNTGSAASVRASSQDGNSSNRNDSTRVVLVQELERIRGVEGVFLELGPEDEMTEALHRDVTCRDLVRSVVREDGRLQRNVGVTDLVRVHSEVAL